MTVLLDEKLMASVFNPESQKEPDIEAIIDGAIRTCPHSRVKPLEKLKNLCVNVQGVT